MDANCFLAKAHPARQTDGGFFQMKIAPGRTVYQVSRPRAEAKGLVFTSTELDLALTNRLSPMLDDEHGRTQIRESLLGLPSTQFDSTRLEAAMARRTEHQDWQVGEAMGEAYLSDHRGCEFPWPSSRDLRNPSASPAGADLVGFQSHANSARLAFGEVKTSQEEKWPPQVVTSRHGLSKQMEELRDSVEVKSHLAIVYLGWRAQGAAWGGTWRCAAARYLTNPADVALFGILVRDVEPREADLETRVDRLSDGCPAATYLELLAFYLPAESIRTLGKRASQRSRR